MTSHYTLVWYSNTLVPIYEQHQPLSLAYSLVNNGVGRFSVTINRTDLPPPFARPSYWQDARIDVYRGSAATPERYEGSFIVNNRTNDTFNGEGLTTLLGRRLVPSSATILAVPAETAMKNAVNAAFADLPAGALSVLGTTGAGATNNVEGVNKDVLGFCGDVAQASAQNGTALYFDVLAGSGGGVRFEVWVGLRGRYRAQLLSEQSGAIRDATGEYDYSNVATNVTAGASGTLTGVASRTASGTFGKVERYVNAGNATTQAEYTACAQLALRQYRPVFRYSGTLVDTPESRYGIDWAFGDDVPVDYEGQELRCRIDAVSVSYDYASGKESINAAAVTEVTL